MTENLFDLSRFQAAQAPVFDRVMAELNAGEKQTQWMWFIFPQVEGLGFSSMAQRFAIKSLEEAQAYLADPVLGLRLRKCIEAARNHHGISAERLLGVVDAVKLRSCLTLFAVAAPGELLFQSALDAFFEGQPDPATLARLSAPG